MVIKTSANKQFSNSILLMKYETNAFIIIQFSFLFYFALQTQCDKQSLGKA
jgi:hypothetical protein